MAHAPRLPLISEDELVAAHQRGEARVELRELVGELVALNHYCRRVVSGECRTSPLEALVHIQEATAAALQRATVVDHSTGRALGHDLEERDTHVSRNDGPVGRS